MNFQKKIEQNVKVPNIGDEFICTADKCKLTCCKGWNVVLDKKTYQLYKANEGIAKNLSKKIGKISRCGETYGSIKMKEDGSCSMLLDNGLCGVQARLGEQALSKTCNTFPRKPMNYANFEVLAYNPACPEVARLVIENEHSMEFSGAPLKVRSQIRQYNNRKGHFNEPGIALFEAFYEFFLTSKLPIWKRLVIIGSITKAFDLDNMLTKEELFATIFKKQIEMENQSMDVDPGLMQGEILSKILKGIAKKTVHNPELRSLLIEAGSTNEFLASFEGAGDVLVDKYVIHRTVFYAKLKVKAEKVWTNLFLSGFLPEIDVFNQSRESISSCLYHQTVWLALIRFLFICTYNPGRHDEYDHLSYVTAVVTRATQHGDSLLLPVLQDLKVEYGDEGALTALLVA